MNCAWKQLLDIIPPWMRSDVDRQGRIALQELRMRQGKPPQLRFQKDSRILGRAIEEEDIRYVINAASRYSPWAASTSAQGFLTACGGHRIGICGEAVIQNGQMTGFRHIRSLNIRVARDLPGICKELGKLQGSLLIIGSPGTGKTTLLRDLIRTRSNHENIAVVDERCELFPVGSSFETGPQTDILTGCSKAHGIEVVLRTMGPEIIAVDEITSEADCEAMIRAGWCGVSLLATAHAAGKNDLLRRKIYQPLIASGIFDHLVILSQDQTFRWERIHL